jgi:hypothetical protein
MTSAGERPWRPSHETKSFILTSCFTGGCWTRTVTVVNPWPISPTQLSCRKAARAVAMASWRVSAVTSIECSTSRTSFTATVHVRRVTSKSVACSPQMCFSSTRRTEGRLTLGFSQFLDCCKKVACNRCEKASHCCVGKGDPNTNNGFGGRRISFRNGFSESNGNHCE